MDALPSTPPSPSPSRARAPLGPSPLDSVSPGPSSAPCHTTRSTPEASASASQSAKSKRRAIGTHIRSFFESTRPTLWTLAHFTTHCHSFSCGDDTHVWTNDKIYSFFIDHLNKLLVERSPLATEAKMKQLLQRAQPRKNTRSRKAGREKEKPQPSAQDSSRLPPAPVPAPITIFQGVGAIISGSSGFSTSQTQNVLDGKSTFSDPPAVGLSDPPPQYQLQRPPPAPRPPLPTTPPPREADGEVPIPGTPPAPPPVPPSGITFSDGTPIDIFLRTLRDNPPPTSPRYPYLLPSNILDLDDSKLSLPGAYLKELFKITDTLLPPVPTHVTYALSRFPSPPDPSTYRSITETSPRPPGAPYSHLPTYINHAISHHLTLISKFRTSATELVPLLREGFYDSTVNPWFIDNLFLACEGSANMFLSRKEILSFIPGCGEKFDGVVRWADGIRAVDLGVVEVKGGNTGSVGAMGGRGDAGGGGDVGKVHRAMSGMLEILRGAVVAGAGGKEGEETWEVLRKMQVLGIVNSGFNVTIMRMMYISPKVKVLRTHRTCRIALHIDRVREVFPLLRLLVQCQRAMENTLEVVLPFLKREGDGGGEEDL